MATAIAAVYPEGQVPAIIEVVTATPQIVLLDAQKRDALFEHIQSEIDAFEPDTTTLKGREAIKSFAYKITRTKTAIDDAGKALNEEARAKINAVDAERRVAREKLTQMATDVRAPLTAWEEAEKARVAECEAVIQTIRDAATVTIEDTFASVQLRGSSVHQTVIDLDRFGTLAETALEAKKATIGILMEAMKRLKQQEADAARLAELEAEKAKRDAEEAERLEAERRVQAKRDYANAIIEHIRQCGLGMIGGQTYPYIILIRELEEKISTGEKAAVEYGDMAGEVERIRVETLEHVRAAQAEQAERSRREAAEQAANEAREEERRKAEEIRQAKEREHEAALQAERDRAAEAERLAQAERDRVAEIERQREQREAAEQAEAERVAAEQAEREANRAHVSTVMREAKEAIMTAGVSEEVARAIVLMIKAETVPHVRIKF